MQQEETKDQGDFYRCTPCLLLYGLISLRKARSIRVFYVPSRIKWVAGKKAKIANVALTADLPTSNRTFDGAAIFVSVSAIGITTKVNKGAELREKTLHFLWDDIPQFELSDAGRIHNPAPPLESKQLGGSRSVSAFLGRLADLANFEIQFGLDCI